jgi:hypothetical protein
VLESVSSVRGVLWKTSALDHLPESVAGAAVFDPMPRVGPVVGYLCRSLEAPCGRSPNTGVVR